MPPPKPQPSTQSRRLLQLISFACSLPILLLILASFIPNIGMAILVFVWWAFMAIIPCYITAVVFYLGAIKGKNLPRVNLLEIIVTPALFIVAEFSIVPIVFALFAQ